MNTNDVINNDTLKTLANGFAQQVREQCHQQGIINLLRQWSETLDRHPAELIR